MNKGPPEIPAGTTTTITSQRARPAERRVSSASGVDASNGVCLDAQSVNLTRRAPTKLGCWTAVAYLIDPTDHTSLSPGSVALEREAVVNNVPFLGTFTGAREWFILLWHEAAQHDDNHLSLEHYFLSKECVDRITQRLTLELGSDDGATATVPLRPDVDLLPTIRTQTLALIAHTEFKQCMREFVTENKDFLAGFNCIGTSTTARQVNELSGTTAVRAFRSGPLGGDVQIAEQIRKGECHKVMFFEDPHYSREHEADIRLLERMARSTQHPVFCVHDHKSAQRWVDLWEQIETGDSTTSVVSLVEAYWRVFPEVNLVLADPTDWSKPREAVHAGDLWSAILKKAVPTVMGLIARHDERRLGFREKSYVGVTWRRSVREFLDELERFRAELDGLSSHVSDHQKKLAYRYLTLGNTVVVPLVGVRGSLRGIAEANQNTVDLAAAIAPIGGDPDYRSLSVPAFMSKASRPKMKVQADNVEDGRVQARQWWSLLDVGIFTCHTMTDIGSGYEAVREAAGESAVSEICGIFLDINGREVGVEHSFDRVGIDLALLRKLKSGGGGVLISGADTNRVDAAVAAVRSGAVSVLVTDLDFAWRLLERHIELSEETQES